MTPRYSLRFESGERQGETIPISGALFTVGRRPGNSLQVADPSVSGRHAELRLENDRLLLRDLGSTNGTRVDGERIEQAQVAAGARIGFGNVQLVLLEGAAVPAASPSRTATRAAPEPEPELEAPEELKISDEAMARARSGSRRVLWIAPLVLAAVGGAWWYGRNHGGGGSEESGRLAPVEPVPGNLLSEGYSFEGEDSEWTSVSEAPQGFLSRAAARRSGTQGMGVELGAGEWAALASPTIPVEPGRGYRVRAYTRVRESATAALRVELLISAGSGTSTEVTGRPRVQSPRVGAAEGFQELELDLHVPAGFTRARVLLDARAEGGDGGRVDYDDVSLVNAEVAAREWKLGLYQLATLGETATTAVLLRAGSVVASEVGLEGEAAAAPAGLRFVEQAGALVLELAPGDVLRVRLEPEALRGGCATIGKEGYSARSADFASQGVELVLLGRDLELFGLRCDPPLALGGRMDQGAMVLAFEAAQRTEVRFQADFQEERSHASELIRAAEAAEREGRMGEALASLGEMLERYPVQADAIAKAEASRARLTRAGLEAVAALRKDFERARFFRLLDLFQGLADRNEDLARRYEKSDVLSEVQALGEAIEAEAAALRERRDAHERARLEAIAKSLRARGGGALTQAVEGYLDTHYGKSASGGARD